MPLELNNHFLSLYLSMIIKIMPKINKTIPIFIWSSNPEERYENISSIIGIPVIVVPTIKLGENPAMKRDIEVVMKILPNVSKGLSEAFNKNRPHSKVKRRNKVV